MLDKKFSSIELTLAPKKKKRDMFDATTEIIETKKYIFMLFEITTLNEQKNKNSVYALSLNSI